MAKEKEFPLAYQGLGWFHKQGKYVKQDWKKAVDFNLKAANKG